MLTITATPRDITKTGEEIRDAAMIPAIMYGPQMQPTSITIDAKAFGKVWREAGESTIVSVTGVGEQHDVLIHDVQVDALRSEPIHVDFYAFDKSKKLTATIPLEFIGVSAAEKAGASIVKVIHEIEIEVLPAELPSHIDVDLSKLVNIDDHITIADLPLPPSATTTLESTEIVVTAVEAKEVEIESAAPTVAPQVLEAQQAAAAAEAAKPKDGDKKKSD
jgi:large subunit ribosomal protein L25